ncbi:LapA family protein [Glutamicibacter sp.]|uniref:LapA family protein n=1 Tax=Glutamicibacter sp. TaxID=1931995 RepID=UPI002FE266D5
MNHDSLQPKKFPTGTLVFGLILIVVSLATLSRTFFHWSFDMPLFLIIVVAFAGVAMIISGLSAAGKRRRSESEIPAPTDPNL